MKHPIIIPSLGLVESVTLVEWVKAPGQTVEPGDVVAVVETEKAQVDIEATVAGSVEHAVEPGPALLAVDAPLGFIDDGL